MIMNMYDYKLMEKLINIAVENNELDVVKERLEARPWWDDGFKALFDMVLKDVMKQKDHCKQPSNIDNSLKFKDSHVVETTDDRATKVKINRYTRSCLRIVSDYLHTKEKTEAISL